ncbi:hypothetical protein AB1K54_16020 [Microbacterium sp. BWT-B31]|uniref:hypothetical protein n=1 Tax=Microbacterium sp. BWT-B31 TaxID=3232072 RepID=UPI0035275F01
MTLDVPLSAAIVDYVGLDVGAIPGNHPDRIASDELRARVGAIMAGLDAIRPDQTAGDLFDWARREVDGLSAASELSQEAREALVSLLSFTWR